MKIILSHDVDHLYSLEHRKDLFWVGLVKRSLASLISSKISASEFIYRVNPIQRLERIDEVLDFGKRYNALPTFFFATRKGLSLSYDNNESVKFIKRLQGQNIPVGLHGMAYNDFKLMKEEVDMFTDMTGLKPVGIRNHYLRRDDSTLNLMDKLGYSFDSTEYIISNPYKIGNMWEIPISLMDVTLGIDSSKKQKQSKTLEIYNKALDKKINYFVINFHDLYFSESYKSMKNWYEWLVTFLSDKHEFIDFKTAISELNE